MRGNESSLLRKAWIFFVISFELLFLGGLPYALTQVCAMEVQ
jgi:hypothetical protein